MSEDGWATFWLIVTVASMVALEVLLSRVHFTPSYGAI